MNSFWTYCLSYYFPPHRLTCPLLPPYPTESSTALFCKGVCCTGDRHRADADPIAEWPSTPSGSTLAVPMNMFITKGEKGWAQRNSYITCRPRQRHYFHCPCNYPLVVRASRVHSSTMRQVSVSSRLRGYHTDQPIFMTWQGAGSLVSIYYCSFCLYLICFMIKFYYPFIFMVYNFIWYNFLFIRIFWYILSAYFLLIIIMIILFI